jgi:predicted small integral membrane protein
MDLSWMAWTLPGTSFSWVCLAGLLIPGPRDLGILLTGLANPRVPGILRIETTRGDRLFISLLGSPSSISPGWVWSDPTCGGHLDSVPDLRHRRFQIQSESKPNGGAGRLARS